MIRIPCPKNVVKTENSSGDKGNAKYDPTEHAVLWKINRFSGDSTARIISDIYLDEEGIRGWNRPPVGMEFRVDMVTASGLKVRSL